MLDVTAPILLLVQSNTLHQALVYYPINTSEFPCLVYT